MIPIRIVKRALTLSNPRWKQYLQNNRTKEGAMLEEIYMVRVSCKLLKQDLSKGGAKLGRIREQDRPVPGLEKGKETRYDSNES